MQLDVRLTLVTEDGGSVLMQYSGIGAAAIDGRRELRMAARFETGDDRYLWLNDLQGVGVGRGAGASVSYDVYSLR